MKFLNKIINWIFGKEKSENYNISKEDKEWENASLKEYEDWLRLEDEKQEAIKKCKGCRDKVFILKKEGEDIAYAANILQLANKTNLPAKSLYRAYNDNRNYKKVYKVTKLE